jgi:hypothetical protein
MKAGQVDSGNLENFIGSLCYDWAVVNLRAADTCLSFGPRQRNSLIEPPKGSQSGRGRALYGNRNTKRVLQVRFSIRSLQRPLYR